MKEEQLMEAIGKIDESMLREVETVRNGNSGNTERTGVTHTGHKGLRRKWLIPVAACMVMMIGGIGAYASGLLGGGSLKTGKGNVGKFNSDYEYTALEDIRIPILEIKGTVRSVTEQMNQEAANFDPTSSQLPGTKQKRFATVEDAVDYIGYKKLTVPDISADVQEVTVQAVGIEKEGTQSSTPEYDLAHITLEAMYRRGEVVVQEFYTLSTENVQEDQTGVRGIVMPEWSITQDTKTVNGRVFNILKTEGLDNGNIGTEVFWQQDKVIYTIYFIYPPAKQDTVDMLMKEWMEAFR